MIARKLAGFLALLGLMALMGGWLYHSLRGSDALPADQVIHRGISVLVIYFVLGIVIAKLGIALVEEVLQDRRDREEERRRRARMRYQAAMAEGEEAPEGEAPAQPPAAGGAGDKTAPRAEA